MELRRPHLGWGGHSLRVGGGGRRSQGREDPKPGIPSILWCLCSLCSHQLLCPPCPPHQVDPNPPMGKLRQRPHSKFSGLKPALELPLPLASSSNLDGGLRRPGRGIPRAQAAFQPATSASDLCHQKSAQRLQSPWGQSHSNSIPTPVLRQQPSNACPGLWGAPSPNLT